MERHTKIALYVLIGEIFAACLLVLPEHVLKSSTTLLWVQTFAGNWSPPKPAETTDRVFFATSIIALAINIGTISAVVIGFWKVVTLQRKTMNTLSALLLKDRSVKNELYSDLPERLGLTEAQKEKLIGAVENSFSNGQRYWMQQILRLMGKTPALALFKSFGYGDGAVGDAEPERPKLSAQEGIHGRKTGYDAN